MEFEIHITVENNKNIEQFKSDCKELSVKPILIEAGNSNQLMTSSKHISNDMRTILTPLYCKLQFEKNYIVKRLKVEKKPENVKDINFIYYETHFRLKLPKNFNLQELQKECFIRNFHLSKNLFKKDDNNIYQMITYRSKNDKLSDFNKIIDVMKNTLISMNIMFDKVEVEECIFDTNESIDNDWFNFKIL